MQQAGSITGRIGDTAAIAGVITLPAASVTAATAGMPGMEVLIFLSASVSSSFPKSAKSSTEDRPCEEVQFVEQGINPFGFWQ